MFCYRLRASQRGLRQFVFLPCLTGQYSHDSNSSPICFVLSFLDLGHSNRIQWHLAVLVCIPLISRDKELLFMHLLAIYAFSLINMLSFFQIKLSCFVFSANGTSKGKFCLLLSVRGALKISYQLCRTEHTLLSLSFKRLPANTGELPALNETRHSLELRS